MSEKSHLYVVVWEDGKPSVESVAVEKKPASWVMKGKLDSYAMGKAFNWRRIVMETERAGMLIGTDPVDAVYLTLEKRKAEEASLEKRLLEVRRELTELSVLGLAEAKVVL